MIENLDQRQATMRRVIQHILDKKPYKDLTFEERRIAKECVDKKYIEGVELVEMVTGRIVMEYRFDPFLTEAGVAFLSGDDDAASASGREEFIRQREMIEQLKKIADANQKRVNIAEKEAADARERLHKETLRSNINAGIAIVAVIVAILAWLIPRELVINTVQNLINHIN